MSKDWWQTDSIQKLSAALEVFNTFLMFEIFFVSSRDTSHSQFGIQNQIFGILWILDYCKFQTLNLQQMGLMIAPQCNLWV
jgi:hypothetical protein